MEAQISPEYLKQFLYSILPEVLEQYYRDKEKELSASAFLERLVRIEEELKSLRIEMNTRFESLTKEMNTRFEAVIKEMNARFEAQRRESDAKFEAINARFEAINTRFEAINTRFEALEKRLNFLQWLMVFGFTFVSVVITLLNFFK